jgi:hypothetical protein
LGLTPKKIIIIPQSSFRGKVLASLLPMIFSPTIG